MIMEYFEHRRPRMAAPRRITFDSWAKIICAGLITLSCSGAETAGPKADEVASVSVAIPASAMHVGDSLQASVTVRNTTNELIVVGTVAWSSTNEAIATVSPNGLVRAVGIGSTRISAMTGGKSGSADLSVTIVPIAQITLEPNPGSVVVGQSTPLAVSLKDASGKPLSGRDIIWSSSDESKATVSSSGVVIGVAAGVVTVKASAEGKSGSATVTVVPISIPVASVSVTIPRSAFRLGETLQAAALPLDSMGGVLTGRNITWSSTNPEIASVSGGGAVEGKSEGIATISAEVDGRIGSVVVQVSRVPVSTVQIDPSTESVSAGASVRLNAILKDSSDKLLTGRAVTWISNVPTIASVSGEGVVTGHLVGSVQITATAETKHGTATVQVNTLTTAVSSITLTPSNSSMSGGSTRTIVPTLRDVDGNVIGGRQISWSSSNPERATVSNGGVVTTAPVNGPAVITATVEGKTANAGIDIVTFTQMRVGGDVCGLTGDGTLYCGRPPAKVNTTLKFVTISVGSNHSCGLVATGDAYCWGDNTQGKLGSGTVGVRSDLPVAVTGGLKFVSIAPGTMSTCATTSDKQVYCWGSIYQTWMYPYSNDGRRDNHLAPLYVGSGMVAVTTGLSNEFCSIDEEGRVYCWDVNFHTTGSGVGPSTTIGPIRGPISQSLRFSIVRMGLGHTCGLTLTGQAYCWGNNDYGQLGDGTTVNRTSPTLAAGGLTFETLAAGGAYRALGNDVFKIAGFTCGMTTSGKAYCWGANSLGELGNGNPTAEGTPVPQEVFGNISFTGIRAGSRQACGLAVAGAAYCWGFGYGSQPTDAFKP